MTEAGILSSGTRQDLQEAVFHVDSSGGGDGTVSSSRSGVNKGEVSASCDGSASRSKGRGVGHVVSSGGIDSEGIRSRGTRGGGSDSGCDLVNSVGCCGSGSFGIRSENRWAGMSPRIYYVPDGTETQEGDRDRLEGEAGGERRSPERQGRVLGRISEGESARGRSRGGKGSDERKPGGGRESRKPGDRGGKQVRSAVYPLRKIETEEVTAGEATSRDGDSRSGEEEGRKERRPRKHQSPSLLQRLLGLLRLLRRFYRTDEEGEWR